MRPTDDSLGGTKRRDDVCMLGIGKNTDASASGRYLKRAPTKHRFRREREQLAGLEASRSEFVVVSFHRLAQSGPEFSAGLARKNKQL
jgi:hypothetical protein